MKNTEKSVEITMKKDGTVRVEMGNVEQALSVLKILSAIKENELFTQNDEIAISFKPTQIKPLLADQEERPKRKYIKRSKITKRYPDWSAEQYEILIQNMEVPASALHGFPILKNRSVASIATKKSAIRYGLGTQLSPSIVKPLLQKYGKNDLLDLLEKNQTPSDPLFTRHQLEG